LDRHCRAPWAEKAVSLLIPFVFSAAVTLFERGTCGKSSDTHPDIDFPNRRHGWMIAARNPEDG